MSRRTVFIVATLLLVMTCLCCTAALSDFCLHNWTLAGDGMPYKIEISISSEGHLYRYHLRYYCEKCRQHKEEPANLSPFPDELVPHDYSISTNHRLTVDLKHAQDLYCNKSSCTFYTTTTHSSTAHLTNQGHTIEDRHWYDYICPDCSRTFYIERSCTDHCPLQAYRIKPNEVEQ